MKWAAFSTCTAAVPLTTELLTGSSSGSSSSNGSSSNGSSSPLPAPRYVLVNPGRYGYYRVNYSRPLWEALAAAADDPEAVPPVDLAGVCGGGVLGGGAGVVAGALLGGLAEVGLGVRAGATEGGQGWSPALPGR